MHEDNQKKAFSCGPNNNKKVMNNHISPRALSYKSMCLLPARPLECLSPDLLLPGLRRVDFCTCSLIWEVASCPCTDASLARGIVLLWVAAAANCAKGTRLL